MDISQCSSFLTPLPNKASFMKLFLSSEGNPDEAHQRELAKRMGFGFRNGVGEVIYAMITTRPDASYAIIRAAQHSACPHEIHYNELRHLYKYLYQTRTQGIYYWRTEPNMALPDVPPPPIDSNFHDLLLDGRPIHNPLELYGHMDSDWAACPITRRSMGGGAIHLAGGAVAYKVNLLVTIAQSSTESEYMQSTALGKVILYARSIMWDLGVPQLTATVAYEDNDACTSNGKRAAPYEPDAAHRH